MVHLKPVILLMKGFQSIAERRRGQFVRILPESNLSFGSQNVSARTSSHGIKRLDKKTSESSAVALRQLRCLLKDFFEISFHERECTNSC